MLAIRALDYVRVRSFSEGRSEPLVRALRAIAVIGLATFPRNPVVLKRLLEIVGTVRAGDSFVVANAHRMQMIAWALLGFQLLIGLVIGAIARRGRSQLCCKPKIISRERASPLRIDRAVEALQREGRRIDDLKLALRVRARGA